MVDASVIQRRRNCINHYCIWSLFVEVLSMNATQLALQTLTLALQERPLVASAQASLLAAFSLQVRRMKDDTEQAYAKRILMDVLVSHPAGPALAKLCLGLVDSAEPRIITEPN